MGFKSSLAWADTSRVDDMASAARRTAWRALLETSGQDGGRALGRTRSGSVEEQPPRRMRGAVTQRELAAKLAAAHVVDTDRYRRLLDRSRDLIITMDTSGIVEAANPAVERILGVSAEQLVGTSMMDFIAAGDLERAQSVFARIAAGEEVVNVELEHITKGGRRVFLGVSAYPIMADGQIVGMEGIARDVTEQHELQDDLTHQAFHDSLTNLPNRALFFDRVDQALARSERDRSQVAVMLLDLDGFKSVNDSLGHAAGDELLMEIAGRLQSVIRAGETVARLGGDEFAMVVDGAGVRGEVVALAERVQAVFEEPFTLGDADQQLTASLGVAVSSAGGRVEAGALLRDADTAMYQAKAHAQGGIEFFAPQLRTELLRPIALKTALETAIRDGELEIRYQPIVSITDGRILALEALVRWLHPMWGRVPPDEFIPLAEKNGMIVALGRYVLGAVAPQIAQWRQEQPGTLPLGVFVNASPQELSSGEFVGHVADTLRANGLGHSDIALELTERAFISEANRTLIKSLTELTKIGGHIVLDDFGTGYSALASLQRFPLAALKIDRLFIQSIHTPDDEAPIVRAIVGLGKSLGMMVIAEGVEDQVQLDYLQRLGCDAAQGYLFARPLHPSGVPSLLSANVRKDQG
jgi:diguanylate cyclase (GGDEF)-like protein/PAS domain S-box-containing protein